MTDAARAVLGLALTSAVAPYLPWLGNRAITRAAFAAFVGAWVAYPLASRWQVWLVVAATACLAAVTPVDRRRDPLPRKIPLTAVAVIAVAVGGGLLLDAGGTWRIFVDALESDRGVAITLGLLAAVFPLGAAIGVLTAPWAGEVERHFGRDEELPRGLQGAGAYIGWLERSAIFIAVVLGHPGAVAAIFTAKSLARFPSFSREAFAEYYLIGTLLSLFGATAAAVGIRLALGLSAT